MKTKMIEATNGPMNWGKFLIGEFTPEEWAHRVQAPGCGDSSLVGQCGWTRKHLLVLDLQTGEGSLFKIGGAASNDLNDKHQIWVCPLFEPFLNWLYEQDVSNIALLPDHIDLKDAPFMMSGYRRTRGGKHESSM